MEQVEAAPSGIFILGFQNFFILEPLRKDLGSMEISNLDMVVTKSYIVFNPEYLKYHSRKQIT
jgi:hypothetical protein